MNTNFLNLFIDNPDSFAELLRDFENNYEIIDENARISYLYSMRYKGVAVDNANNYITENGMWLLDNTGGTIANVPSLKKGILTFEKGDNTFGFQKIIFEDYYRFFRKITAVGGNTNFGLWEEEVIDSYTNTSKVIPPSADALKRGLETKFNNIGIMIPSDSDLNTYKTHGHFRCSGDATAATIINAPFGTHSFTLVVDSMGGEGTPYITQLATEYNTAQIKTRYTYDSGVTWSPWIRVVDESTGANFPGDVKVTRNTGDVERKLGVFSDGETSRLYLYDKETSMGIYTVTPNGDESIFAIDKATGGMSSGVFEMRIIRTVEEVGLTPPVTTIQLAQAMPYKSIAIIDNSSSSPISDSPFPMGILTINKPQRYRVDIQYATDSNSNRWALRREGSDINAPGSTSWVQDTITYTLLADLFLTQPVSVETIVKTMVPYSNAIIIDGGDNGIVTNTPNVYGTLLITKGIDNHYVKIEFSAGGSDVVYKSGYKVTTDSIYPWEIIQTTSDPPVPIGGVLVMSSATSPADFYPGTTWTIGTSSRYIRGSDQANVATSGGSFSLAIAQANLPNFNMNVNAPVFRGREEDAGGGVGWENGSEYLYCNSGGSGTDINVQPEYLKYVFWHRLT